MLLIEKLTRYSRISVNGGESSQFALDLMVIKLQLFRLFYFFHKKYFSEFSQLETWKYLPNLFQEVLSFMKKISNYIYIYLGQISIR